MSIEDVFFVLFDVYFKNLRIKWPMSGHFFCLLSFYLNNITHNSRIRTRIVGVYSKQADHYLPRIPLHPKQ